MKFTHVVLETFEQTDKQTNKQTHRHTDCNTLYPYWSKVIISHTVQFQFSNNLTYNFSS